MSKDKRNKKDIKMHKELDKKFSEEYGETFGNETVIKMNVADANKEYMEVFGANKNLYRTIPSLISGLKPGEQRVLFSWWHDLEHCPMNTKRETLNKLKYYRVDKLSSTATASYHPHGGAALDEMIGKKGQYWNNNVMVIVPQGSYGNMRGDKPAAGRYIMAKLSEYAIDCFFDDFDKYCIPMKQTYDGSTYEPEYLPAKYPHVLFNPQFSGIGYGMASNIPSFNVAEVLDATIKLIKDPTAKILLIPDMPTGSDIVDIGTFKDLNKTGVGKIMTRATSEIDYSKNVIKINTLPPRSDSKSVIEAIAGLRSQAKDGDEIKKIDDIKDYTKEGEVNIEIYLKPDAKPDKVLQILYKKDIGLKTTFPVSITVIDDYVDYEYGVKDLLLAWIDYRLDAVRSMLLNKYQVLLSDKHINEVLLMIFDKKDVEDRINEIIDISRKSKTTDALIEALMKRFKITSLQARTLADMRVRNFNIDSYNKYVNDKESLDKEIKEIEGMISDDSKLEEFVINQLEEGKKKYGRPRMSKIVKEDDKSNDSIPDTDHLIGISESGFIKKLSLKNATSIGHVGKTNSSLTVLSVNNKENILIIDSLGYMTKLSVSAIPDMEFDEIGVEINKFFSVKGDIKAVMELPSMDILKVADEDFCVIFVTKKGIVKKVHISAFKKITDSKLGITLNDGDEVASAIFAFDKLCKDIIISTNIGNGIRLPLEEIKTVSLSAKGLSTIAMKDEEEVVSASLINPKKKYLFYVTSSGRVKVTEMKYFPAMKRKDETLALIGLQGNETLVGVSAVDKNDIVRVYKKKGEPEDIAIKEIEVGTRISKGEKKIKTGRGDVVVGYKVFTTK